MKTLFVNLGLGLGLSLRLGLGLGLALTACSHHQSAPTTPASSSSEVSAEDEPAVDPTLPSWAPRSCSAYHAEVVQAAACEEIAQATRDSIKRKYDTANDAWQAMHDAPPGELDAIKVICVEDAKSVHRERVGKCAVSARP